MATLRALVVFGLILSFAVAAKAQEERAKSPVAAPLKPSTPKPEFPLVVRIDDAALDSLRAKDIRHQGPIDRIVLGTRAIGTSWTTGAIDVEMMPDRDDATITLRFRGKTQTKTAAYNGPAIIHSHTDTDFECARQIVFEPRIGLVAGPSAVESRTDLAFDGFDANRRLGRRLISRVAERRASEQFEEARAIAQRDNEAEVSDGFDKRLNGQLAAINRQLDIARYVNVLLGPTSKPLLATRSSKNTILIGIGNEESPRRMVTFPPERKKPAPIEIWIHNSAFGDRFAGVAAIVEKVEESVLPAAIQLQILQVVLGPAQTAEQQFDVGYQDGWVVIGLQNDAPTPAVAASSGR